MSRTALMLTIACAAGALFVTAASGRTSTDYYWPSFEAQQAVQNSDWGDARGVDSVACRGLGAFKKTYSLFTFKRFRCELKNASYERIGFVTVRTTGPEAWKPENFIRPRCS